ncbi:MAG: hypothetical protein L3J14_03345 [Flavobacteriaceae bacterium]|nr:hypothetical protein [Flavobacteriaceae bacterium]
MNLKSLTSTEILGYSFLILLYVLGIYFANTDPSYFKSTYAREDGFVEYTTAAMLLYISILSFSRLFKLWSVKPALWKLGVLGFALIFLFGAGEEISWGQRIFDIESSAYFKENNAQQETNLHNMVVGETKINKLIFSQILTIVLVIYLIILPLLYRKFEGIKNLVDKFAVPLPRWNHTIAFLLATVLLSFIPSDKKWEVYELAFSIIFLLIFLNPFNKYIYEKN